MAQARIRSLVLLASGVLAAGGSQAQAPAPRPKPPAAAPAAVDPGFEAMRSLYEALPEAERKALQDALVWTGDYNSVVTGSFGRRTYEGLNAYRTRTGALPDPLDPKMRAAIIATGDAARKAARFTVKLDPASGAVLGVPERLLPKRSPVPGGTRWQSADGRITLESRSFPPGGTDLDALFERATAPLNDRKVTYKLKRPDFIVVTGETGSGRSYVRYALGDEGIRGFALGYDRAAAAEVDRLVIAVANSFVPFPDAQPAVADAPQAPPTQSPVPPVAAAPRPAATGLVVAAGKVLTASAALEGCPALRIGTIPARVAKTDPARGLVLLEGTGLPAPIPPRIRPAAVSAGDALVVVAADAGGLSVAPGTGSGAGGVHAPLQPGAGGASVLDRSGALAGLVARFPAAPRLIAGVMPPMSHPLVPASTIAAFLAENGIPTAPAGAPETASVGAVAGRLSPAVVAVTCQR